MEHIFARLSKAGRVVCGKPHTDGGYYCDEPLAALVPVHEPPRYPERHLAALPGWRPDRKRIWRRTTSVEDRRAHGLAYSTPQATIIDELPTLVCCAKCGAIQWLDASRLNVVRRSTDPTRSRWFVRS